MKALIQEAHREWRAAKDKAEQQCRAVGDTQMADQLAACRMFEGTENLQQLADLLFTPRGAEFVTTYGFPSLALWRRLTPYKPETYGIYIDAGEIALTDAERVLLVGGTKATLRYSTKGVKRIVVVQGASADIKAKGYAIARIEKDKTAHVTTQREEDAIILC